MALHQNIAGLSISNPTGMILSTVMLMEWLAERHQDPKLKQIAGIVETGLYQTMESGIKTKDLGGQALTTEFVEAIVNQIN